MTYVNNSGAVSDFLKLQKAGSTSNPVSLPVFITFAVAFANENLKLVINVLQILAPFPIFVLYSTKVRQLF